MNAPFNLGIYLSAGVVSTYLFATVDCTELHYRKFSIDNLDININKSQIYYKNTSTFKSNLT